MSDWKEVWHVWDGIRVVEDVVKLVNFEGIVERVYSSEPSLGEFYLDEDLYIAYTTGQMRRRVECDLCKNTGLFCYEGLGCVVCPRCNGKGYLWEYK